MLARMVSAMLKRPPRPLPFTAPPSTDPVLAVADLVLSTLCLGAGTGAGAAPPPPFTVDALSAAPSSGAAMEDWLASVVAGGDGQDGDEGLSEAAGAGGGGAEDEDDADELLVPGGRRHDPAYDPAPSLVNLGAGLSCSWLTQRQAPSRAAARPPCRRRGAGRAPLPVRL